MKTTTPNQRTTDFYDLIRRSFEGNNHVYKVEVTLYDGATPLKIVFDTPKGFKSHQREREGTLEVRTDADI